MKTQIFKINDTTQKEDIKAVAQIIRDGGLAAIPTETVYGLAANALDPDAVNSIFGAKGRPNDNPLIVHISEIDEIYPLVTSFPDKAKALAEAFWPGPLTIILPKSDIVPKEVCPRLETVAVRMPSHPIARAIIKQAGVPLAAPSANSSGLPSPTKAQHVIDDMNGKIQAIVDGGESSVGVESTVITLATEVPMLLRPGGITPEQIESVIGPIEINPAVLEELPKGAVAASPGMKYKHYSPEAQVYIIKGEFPSFKCYVETNKRDGDYALCFSGEENKFTINAVSYGKENCPEEQAHNLFSLLRELDAKGAKRIFVRRPDPHGVGLAVYNRLIRAAAFRVIEMPLIYGLTGQTGAGKTTVANELLKKGWQVIDCDLVARKVVEKGSPVLPELTAAFGEEILLPDGSLDRKSLAQKAFSTEEGRKKLNSITHPAITKQVSQQIINEKDKFPVFVVDAALLSKSELYHYCSKVIVVVAKEDVRLKRIIKRDSITPEQAITRIKAQPDEQYYRSVADVVVENNGDEIDLSDIS
ncbi:MAG: threonylcarbamoyl-AMP synthase [Clostridia bacterium]|nr:threonylcarbamoyl-AMP synthase [Clostridia bacterium]